MSAPVHPFASSRAPFLIALLATLAVAAPASAARFYLSTERVFAPGQQPQVRLEANGVSALDVRLYRIDDPRAWFDAQTDLHRPSADNRKPRPASLPLLKKGARRHLEKLLLEVRKGFGAEGRRVLKEGFPSLHTAAFEGAREVRTETVLPPLKEHKLLDAWRYVLPDRYGWIYDVLPVPVAEPGAYLVEATADNQVAYTVVLVTDVALVTKQSSSQLLVWAIDPASGDPRPGTEVTVLEGGDEKASKTTDKDGVARFDTGLLSSPVIYAKHERSFTLLDPRFFSSNLPEPRVYLFTERPVYRPGQEVFFKGFARDVADELYQVPKSGAAVSVSVIDPEGNVLESVDAKLSAKGSFDGRFELPDEPTLGTWQLVAEIDGKRHAGQFKVMAYIKPEVKLSVRLDESAVRSGEGVAGEIEGAYFFGAPYPGAEVKITVTRTRFYIPWYVDADYAWYYSEAEYRNTKREVIQESRCKLDDKGRCPFEFTTKPDSEDYTYVVEATAVDPTGKTISGSTTATVTRGAFRLSLDQEQLIVKPGAAQTLTVRAEDYSRRPVETEVKVLVRARRLAKDGVLENVEVMNESVRTDATGRAVIKVDPSKGGYYEVIATAKDDRGTEIKQETFLFASEGSGDLPFAPSDLEIVTDKRSYFAGDTALVLVLAPSPDAKVLFSVEGGELYRAEVLTAQRHALLARVDIGEKQTPNFYLAAATLSGGQLFTRQRSVVVPPREKLLTVEVSPDRPEAQPGEDVTFTVHVADFRGTAVKDAEVALGVVDEAIYAISPEIAVPLEGFFYHRKRNDVRTSDSVSFRFFGTSRGLKEKTARLFGESPFAFGSMKPQLDDVRKVFKDTAGWFPTLTTDGEGRAQAKVTLPDNLTSWRATARAVSPSTQVGMGAGNVKARKPLIVRVALPPRLVEGDRGAGAVLVQNLSGKEATFTLAFEVNGASREGDTTPPALSLAAALPGEVKVKDGENLRVPFTYEAKGSGPLEIVAKANGGGLADAVQARVDVDEWARVRRVSASGRTSSELGSVTHALTIPDGARLEEVELEVELSSSSLAAIRGSLPYLVEFPWGCTEQTMSRYLPALAVREVLGRLSIPQTSFEQDLDKALAFGEQRLLQLQHDDGGWGWWEHDASDLWMTSYVVEGLGQAKALGQSLDDERLTRALGALERLLSRGSPDPSARAFAVYALARHGRHQRALLDTLLKEAADGKLGATALAHVIESAALAGRTEDAQRAAKILADKAKRSEPHRVAWWGGLEAGGDDLYALDFPAQRADAHPVEATAVALLALSRVTGYDALRADAESFLMHQYGDGRFGTTRQTALAVRALASELKAKPLAKGSLKVKVDGEEVAAYGFTSEKASDAAVRLTPKVKLGQATVSVEVVQEGGDPIFHTVSLRAPVRARELPAVSTGGLHIARSYTRLGGAQGAWRRAGAATKLETGETVLVTLTVDAAREVEHAMIEDPRPASLSAVERDSGLQVQGVQLRPAGVRREHRDDRTAFFFRRLPRGKTTLHYLARAGLDGSFHALPARVESMYLPATYEAQSSSDAIEIRSP